MTDHLIYTEGVVLGRWAKGVAAAAIAMALFDVATGWALEGWGVLGASFALILAAALYGVYRFGRIVLSADTLTVGTETLAVGQIDRSFGIRRDDALTNNERAEVERRTPVSKESTIRMPGGGWGRNLTYKLLVAFEPASGKKIVLQTRRPDELETCLRVWLAA